MSKWIICGALLFLCSCAPQEDQTQKIRIGMMPKLVGIDYFNACEKGARAAAAELGVELVYDGPLNNDVGKQAEMLDTWMAMGLDAIAVAPNDPNALSPTLRRAMQQRIKVLTWDADSAGESRHYFVNQATYEDIGSELVNIMAEQIGPEGDVAIVTGSLTAANQNIWMEWMNKRIASAFPGLQIVAVRPSEEDQQLAYQVSQDLLKAHPTIRGVWGITSVAFPGAAAAIRDAGRSGEVAVVGLATPNGMKEYVRDGTVETVLLWNPVDLGYLTVQAAVAAVRNDTLGASLTAGRLGEVTVLDDQVLLGAPMQFDKDNIEEFDF